MAILAGMVKLPKLTTLCGRSASKGQFARAGLTEISIGLCRLATKAAQFNDRACSHVILVE